MKCCSGSISFERTVSPSAKMEKELDDVEDGNIQWVQIIDSFYKDFEKRVEKAEAEMQEVEIEPEYAGVDL